MTVETKQCMSKSKRNKDVTLGVDGWCEAGLELRAEIPLPVFHFEDGATKRWYRARSTHAP